jgi:PTS system ascorbate-specific IIA component
MVGVLLVTHATLGEALIECVCHVLNRRPVHLQALAVMPQDDPRDLLPGARALLERLDPGGGVLVLTDLFGATPANLAVRLLQPGRVAAVAGVSLPMLLRVLTYREQCALGPLVERAVTGARDGVVRMKPL